jgi:Uma2 family endonuclease
MIRTHFKRERSYVPKTIVPPTQVEALLLKKRLPTMYDLPSENPEEPGLPDDFHYHQPQLLRETFRPPKYSAEEVYVASDLNLYYDVRHHDWYKRPDWFAVLGVPPFYGTGRELRYSYVIWQENVAPFIAVELLSESTEKEDLGKTLRGSQKPPTKWEVYEQQLRIPYYVVFSREPKQFHAFQLRKGRYHELTLDEERFWLPQIQLGLGLWKGNYHGSERQWLRWYDALGRWVSTPVEIEKQRADSEKQRANSETQRADSEAQRADSAEAELTRLKALFAEKGLSP